MIDLRQISDNFTTIIWHIVRFFVNRAPGHLQQIVEQHELHDTVCARWRQRVHNIIFDLVIYYTVQQTAFVDFHSARLPTRFIDISICRRRTGPSNKEAAQSSYRINLEWHWIASLCWCAVKKLLTHSVRWLSSLSTCDRDSAADSSSAIYVIYAATNA